MKTQNFILLLSWLAAFGLGFGLAASGRPCLDQSPPPAELSAVAPPAPTVPHFNAVDGNVGPWEDDPPVWDTVDVFGAATQAKPSPVDPTARYLELFAGVAKREQRRTGVPASITLAQGILESGVGRDDLAVRLKNHFGLKCFSKTCAPDHCANKSDDHHKDYFLRFNSAWDSYEAHGDLLSKNDRYAKLFEYPPTDYRKWARGLQAAGYATDPKYGDKLIALIENLRLNRFDV